MANLTQEKNSNFLSISRTAGFIYPPAIKSLYAMVRRMYDLCTVKFWPLARNLGSLIPEKRKRNEKNSRGYTTPLRPRKGHSFPTFTIFYPKHIQLQASHSPSFSTRSSSQTLSILSHPLYRVQYHPRQTHARSIP